MSFFPTFVYNELLRTKRSQRNSLRQLLRNKIRLGFIFKQSESISQANRVSHHYELVKDNLSSWLSPAF